MFEQYGLARLSFRILLVLLLLVGLQATDAFGADGSKSKQAQKAPIFEEDVLPIFEAKCVRCHGSKVRKGNLNLSSLTGVLKGSESGKILARGKVEESSLYEMVHKGEMPADGKNPPTKAEIETIRLWIETGAQANETPKIAQGPAVNQHDVIPIMLLRCTVCHGLRRQEAGLDLRTKESMLEGGKSGPAIVPGKPEESLIIQKIRAQEMPPPKKLVDFGVRPVEQPELETLTKWISLGAPEVDIEPDVATKEPDPLVTDEDRDFWSFQPPQRPDVPMVEHQDRVRNPIDAFILRKLEEKDLALSPEADRLTLIRRVAFDLTGLPPTPEEIDTFLSDDSDHAYEDMINRYLSSSRYGERWGQYWLDLAGYADSEGKRNADPVRPHAWRYRDYVIRAFNNDKPYDRFLMEQLAGDELANYKDAPVITQELMDNLVATGFLRMAPDGTGSDIVNTATERLEVISDEIDVFGSAVLGLTVNCAQCHSHKYDPIPQRDYYRLQAVFKGAYDEYDWLKPSFVPNQTKAKSPGRVLPYVTDEIRKKWEREKGRIEAQIDEVNSELKNKRQQLTEKHVEKRLAELPKELRGDLRKMLRTPAKKRDEVQKYLAKKFEKKLRIDENELKKLEPEYKKLAKKTEKEVKKLKSKIPDEPRIRALWDRGQPSPTYIYRRGEFTKPGRLVGPGVPSVLTDGKTPFEVKPPWPGAEKTGRRLALARWVTQPDHPLTARVMVNRIWRYHFGRGIVKTLDNFGKTGSPPTHPDLLDWLAREFVARGWSIKQMHRLMMTSSTYRQRSTVRSEHEEKDPQNKLLARMPLRRMEAEVVRDSILKVSGQLDHRQFGKPDPVSKRHDGLVTSQKSSTGWRRSVYVKHRRKEIPTILENFDRPQMMPNCVERPHSTVASQALHLMNNKMIRDLSRSFAERVKRDVGSEPYRQIERTYRLALGRFPTDQEKEISLKTLKDLTQQWRQELKKRESNAENLEEEATLKALANFCHTMINSAAFLYID